MKKLSHNSGAVITMRQFLWSHDVSPEIPFILATALLLALQEGTRYGILSEIRVNGRFLPGFIFVCSRYESIFSNFFIISHFLLQKWGSLGIGTWYHVGMCHVCMRQGSTQLAMKHGSSSLTLILKNTYSIARKFIWAIKVIWFKL